MYVCVEIGSTGVADYRRFISSSYSSSWSQMVVQILYMTDTCRSAVRSDRSSLKEKPRTERVVKKALEVRKWYRFALLIFWVPSKPTTRKEATSGCVSLRAHIVLIR